MFPEHAYEFIGHYVYRLVDPRDGATFYVGRGQKNRAFQHVENALAGGESNAKGNQIRDIRNEALRVITIIHRHELSEAEAKLVEAALIDAYPQLTNQQRGEGSSQYGVVSAERLAATFALEEANIDGCALLFSINRTSSGGIRTIADAVRYAWGVDVDRASTVSLVLAIKTRRIVGVFTAHNWRPATFENFPTIADPDYDLSARWGFDVVDVGHLHPHLLNKRLPENIQIPRQGWYYVNC